jgi:hypothetical protein
MYEQNQAEQRQAEQNQAEHKKNPLANFFIGGIVSSKPARYPIVPVSSLSRNRHHSRTGSSLRCVDGSATICMLDTAEQVSASCKLNHPL